MTPEIRALIGEMREAAIHMGQSGSTPIGYRVQQWAERLAALISPKQEKTMTPEIQALVTKLEETIEGAYAIGADSWAELMREAIAALVQQTQKEEKERVSKHHPACDPGWGPANYRCHPDCPVAHPVQQAQVEPNPHAVCNQTIENYERNIAELVEKLARVTAERDNFKRMYEEIQAGVSSGFLDRAEAAEAALSRMTGERDEWKAQATAFDQQASKLWNALSAHREALQESVQFAQDLASYAFTKHGNDAGLYNSLKQHADHLAALASPRQQEQEHKDKEADHARMDSQT